MRLLLSKHILLVNKDFIDEKVPLFGKTDIQKGKKKQKNKTLFGDTVYKTDLSNIEQLPSTELYLLYSSIIHVNRSIYVIVNLIYYRFPYTVLSLYITYICATPPLINVSP